jgi:regulatory protein
MIEITDIKKNKSNYVVYVGDQKYSLSDDTILRFQLYIGKNLTDEDFAQVLKHENDNQMYAKVLNFISFKERTEYEIKQYLFKKALEYPQIVQILEKLKSQGYIDDDRYASHLIDTYINKGKGKKYIKQKLLEKGIDKQRIEEIIVSISDTIQYDHMLLKIEKELPRLHKFPINKQKQMLIQKFQRDGYPHNLIAKIIQNQEFSSDHKELLQREMEKLKRKYKDNITKEIKQKMISSLLMNNYDIISA